MQLSVTPGSFTLERTFKAPVGRVYEAFAEKSAKEKWFHGPDDSPDQHELDFQVGGRETNEGKFHDGTTHSFEALYYDIVPEERIIYTYEMHIEGKLISVSLATIEFTTDGERTHLKLSESGVFLDGFDKPEVRQRGTEELLNALAASVE